MQEVWTLQGLAHFWKITHPGLGFQPGLYQRMPVALFFRLWLYCTLVCLCFPFSSEKKEWVLAGLGVCSGPDGAVEAPWAIGERKTSLSCSVFTFWGLKSWHLPLPLPPCIAVPLNIVLHPSEGGNCSCSPSPGRASGLGWPHRQGTESRKIFLLWWWDFLSTLNMGVNLRGKFLLPQSAQMSDFKWEMWLQALKTSWVGMLINPNPNISVDSLLSPFGTADPNPPCAKLSACGGCEDGGAAGRQLGTAQRCRRSWSVNGTHPVLLQGSHQGFLWPPAFGGPKTLWVISGASLKCCCCN